MAVTPYKTFAGGEVLTASDLNSSFSQVFDNGEDLAWPATQSKDLNGQELILDADGDTSITADTDDQIDFKIAGTDYVAIKGGATNSTVTITNDSLTTGTALLVTSNSTDTSARNLVSVVNDNTAATGARCYHAQQDSDDTGLFIDMNGNGQCIDIDTDQTTANVFRVNADSLTTGSIISVVSDSADTSSRNLVHVINDNSAAINAVLVGLDQDADQSSISIDSEATTASVISVFAPATTTGNVLSLASVDSLTTGRIARFESGSSDASTRELVTIHNNHASAVSTTCLELIQDSQRSALDIYKNDIGYAALIDSDDSGFYITAANTTTTSEAARLILGNNSATGNVLVLDCDRAATGSYSFLIGRSNTDGSADTEFDFSGSGNGFCDGSFTGGGADYAEFFEWADGNPDNEDRRGISVELVGDKIRPATEASKVFGVISGNPSIVGDAAWNKWAGKYLRDDYGSYIMEDYEVWSWHDEDGKLINYASDRIPEGVDVPDEKEVVVQQRRKLNPNFDPGVEYVKRADRPEWGCVGLVGKLRVKKGQVTGTHWFKMRDISASVEEWLVR